MLLLAQIALTATISKSGVGPVKFGMTPAQAAAAGVALTPAGNSGACYVVHPASPQGVSFVVSAGKIVRADIVKPAKLKTVDGFTFGDVEGNVAGFYAATPGGVTDEPLGDTDITVLASPEFSAGASIPRLVYELHDQGGVLAIHAGYVPRGFNPHGCQ
ncbi:MAG: hypothetical protein JO092_12400 [Candidatus Eremiobacteraeota bacterium]|nr:hypothetical protein [Candidatus Eremiobacteraeota bacterium]MBV8721004.1 hypothetical protein [Candidatus Eremiobacteraeota bacterium]